MKPTGEGEKNIPRITNWEAIDSMAYGKREEQKVCPLCSGPKDVRGLTCRGCRFSFGEDGARLIKSELGRRNPLLWERFVGSVIDDMRREGGGNGQKRKVRVGNPSQPVPKNCQRDLQDLPTGEKGGGSERELEQGKESGVSVAEIGRERETDGGEATYPIGGGLTVFRRIMEETALGHWQKRRLCPVCGENKDTKDWLCPSCFSKFGVPGVISIKEEMTKINPQWSSQVVLSKEDFDSIRNRVVLILESNPSTTLLGLRELATSIGRLGGFPHWIPEVVLRKIAEEAMKEKRERQERMACLIFVKKIFSKKGSFLDLNATDLAEKMLYEFRAKHSVFLLEWAVRTIRELFSDFSEVFAESKKKGLDAIRRNLRENPELMEAFRLFLINQTEEWQEKRRNKGENPSLAIFIKEIGFNPGSFYGIRKHPLKTGITKKKATQIAERLGFSSLEEALFGK